MKTLTPLLLALALAGPVAAQAQGVTVLSAWYGQSCGAAHGNVTALIKSRCDGKAPCNYPVDVNALGDAAPGCAKNLVVLFACPGQTTVRLAQLPAEAHGKTLTLACTP